MTARKGFVFLLLALGVVFWSALRSARLLSAYSSAPARISFGGLDLLHDLPERCVFRVSDPFPRHAAFDSKWGMKLAARRYPDAWAAASGPVPVLPLTAISRGMPIARSVLSANGGANPCAALFGTPPGVTPSAVLNQVDIAFRNLHNTDLYAEEFDPADPGNPQPTKYTIVFNTDPGNLNGDGGPREAADTIVHELIHVVFGMSDGAWVQRAIRQGWVNADWGDGPASEAAQVQNDRIVSQNCFPDDASR
jgi:hypothetical protein